MLISAVAFETSPLQPGSFCDLWAKQRVAKALIMIEKEAVPRLSNAEIPSHCKNEFQSSFAKTAAY